MGLFDSEPDFEDYLDERLMRFTDLKERELFRDIMADALKNLFHQLNEEYISLEQRVFSEVPRVNRMPDIVTGMCKKDEYDLIDQYMFPMRPEDLEPHTVLAEEMLASLKENKPFKLYTCFFEEDYLELKNFEKSERVFTGTIENEFSESPAEFILKPNTSYLKQVEEVYPLAWLNMYPWRTVNCPLLYKMYDVYVTKVEEWDDEQEVKAVKVNFDEYEGLVHQDLVPLWNLRPVTIKANSYPQPVGERSYYEHSLNKEQFKEEYSYILKQPEWNVQSMRWADGDFYAICEQEMPADWDFYEVSEVKGNNGYGYPYFTNRQDRSFSRDMIEHFGQRIKTRTELIRFINSFGHKEVLSLIDAKVTDIPKTEETYSFEKFIEYEYRSGNWQKALLVSFRPAYPDYYLNRDIMSFLTTSLQHFFPEFKCIGQLV